MKNEKMKSLSFAVIFLILFTSSGFMVTSATASIVSIDVEKWVKYKDEPETEYRKVIDNAKVSDTVTFKIAIHNDGSTRLTNIWVFDDLGCALEYIEGSANISPTYYDDSCPIYQELWWEFPARWLDPGESLNITFDAHIDECGEGVNEVYVEAEDATGEYPYDTDNVRVTCEVEEKPDLEIVDKRERWVNETHYNVTYVIHNTGTAVAPAGHNTTLYIDGVPVDHKQVSVALAPCQNYTDTFDTVIECTGESDTVKVCTDNDDVVDELNEDNNCLENVLWMMPALSVNKVANPISGAPSTNVTFTITVGNNGDSTLNPVTVIDTLPGGMSYISSNPKGSVVGNTIRWNVGPLASGTSETITLVAQIDEGAAGMLTNYVTATGTPPEGADVTGYDTAEIEVLARTIEPPQQTLFYVATEVRSDGTVIEEEKFGWETGNANLLNNPPLASGEAVGGIKYDDKMIGSNGTTEFGKSSGLITDFMPNLAVTKDIGYKSGDMGSLSSTEQAGMRYSGASPPLSSTKKKCEDVNAYSAMIVTDVNASTETEVGITDTDERNLHYGIKAEGKGSVSAGIDASAEERVDRRMLYAEESTAYSGNFSLEKEADYTSKRTSTSTSTDLKGKGDSTVIVGGQFRGEKGSRSLWQNDKMIGTNGSTEFEQEVDARATKFEADKSIGYTSGNMGMGSLSHDEQVGMCYSGTGVNAYSEMVVMDVEATTETEVGRELLYETDAKGKGSVSAGVDASASSMSYKDKSAAYGGNFSLHKKVDCTSKPSTSIITDLKGDSTVVEDGQLGWGSGTDNLKYGEKMIGSNGTTEFEKCVDVSMSNLDADKSIGYKSGDLGSLSHAEQVGMRYSGTEVNAYSDMVVTDVEAATETGAGITERSLHYGIAAGGNGSVSAGVDASVVDDRTGMRYVDKANAYGGNLSFEKKVGYGSKSP